jgi:hypothetical protein
MRKHSRFCDPHDLVSWVKELNGQPRTVTPPLFSDLPPASGRQIEKKRVIGFDILAVKLVHQSGEPTGVNVTKSN